MENSLIDCINYLEDPNVNIDIYFLKKRKKDEKMNYETFNPVIGEKLEEKLTGFVKKALKNNKDKTVKDYNIVGSDDDTIEKVNIQNYLSHIEKLKNSIKPENCGEDNNLDKNNIFDFALYKFTKNKEELYAVRRISKMKRFEKGIIGSIVNGKFKDIDDFKGIYIDEKIDFIIYGDYVYVLNHTSFERILNLRNEFKEKATKILDEKKLSQKINGFDQLKEEILNNGNYIRRVAKISQTETLFLDNLNKTKEVIDAFNLEIKLDDDKLFYERKEQVADFINLMQDSYYKTLIGEEKGIDDRK